MEYLSNEVQNCFLELIYEDYEKSQKLIEAIAHVAIYLLRETNDYDYVLKKYKGVSKELIIKMVISNFLELTYYRREKKIPLNHERLAFLNAIENTEPFQIVSFLNISEVQFAVMVNDTLLYFEHIASMYNYNAAQAVIQSGFARELYAIYPLALNEHILTLNDTYTRKEMLLSDFLEEIVNATERIDFSIGFAPSFTGGYRQRIVNNLKNFNGHNPDLPNLHEQIIEAFLARTNLRDNPEDKALMLEIVICTLREKQEVRFPLSQDEVFLLASFEEMEKSLASFSSFFDNNENLILNILLNNWHYFETQEMLEDLPEFNISRSLN